MTPLLALLISIVALVFYVWVIRDAALHNRSQWQAVGHSRLLWIVAIVLFGPIGIAYLVLIRPRLNQPEILAIPPPRPRPRPVRRPVSPLALRLMRLAAPLAAVAFALLISALVLHFSGSDPLDAFRSMWDFGTTEASIASIIDRAVPLYLSGVAFAIAFKMGLFNIGVESQYTVAVLFAAYIGAKVDLPPVVHVSLILAVAIAVGSVWAGIAGVLKVTRGVHEVISTIMLNFIGTALISYLLANHFLDRADETLNLQTEKISESGWFPVVADLGPNAEVGGFVVVAALVGLLYYLLIWRTRFGFDLRISGLSPFAAQASGVASGPMIVKGMLLSGAVAGLVGMSTLLGDAHNYGLTFATGFGFTGITVALLGRNNPLGIAIGALLLAFLDRSSQILDLEGVAKEIVVIMEGVIVLSVVIAYELVQRLIESQQQHLIGDEEGPPPSPAAGTLGAPA